MVKFSEVAPVLPVRRLDDACAHYRRLGFAVTTYDGGGYGYAQRGSAQLHLSENPDTDPATSMVSVYLYVDDVDALAAEWAAIPGRLVPPRDTDYGLREAAHVDPDGNLLRFGSPIQSEPDTRLTVCGPRHRGLRLAT